MTTFDLAQVQEFASAINAQLDRCDHGEGAQCATIEAALNLYADCCCQFVDKVRQWARDVFTGKVAFNLKTEQSWKLELTKLYERARSLAEFARRAEFKCWQLDEQKKLDAAIWHLERLINGWVTPKLAVGPSARRKLDGNAIAEARRRIASLTPLPPNWEPEDPVQRAWLHKARSFRTKTANE